jgi:predicted phosphodiesterase
VRVGVVSDPHGDRDALERVLDACAEAGCDERWCLGDLVGDPDPNGTVRLAVAVCDVVLAGNHDLVASGRLGEVYVESHGGPRMMALQRSLERDVAETLQALPERETRYGVELVHASLSDPLARVADVRGAETQLGLAGTPVVVVGHSHDPFAYDHATGTFIADPLALGRLSLSAHGGVLCPGSVQRLVGRAPTWLELDLTGCAARWHCLQA